MKLLQKLLCCSLLFLNIQSLFCQYRQLEKVKRALEEGDFLDAKERILKMDTMDLEEKVCYYRANHLFFCSTRNTEYEPIKAFQYNKKVISFLKVMIEKDKKKLCENKGICEFDVELEQDKVARLILSFIKKKQDLSYKKICLSLLVSYPEYPLILDWSDSLELVVAKNRGTREALLNYNREHQNSSYLQQGVYLLEEFDFRETVRSNSEKSFDDFAEMYPHSLHREFIEHKRDSASYKVAELSNSIEAYRFHLKKHPNGETAALAKERIEHLTYQKIKKEKSLSGFDAFLREFPDSKFNLEIKLLRDTIMVQERVESFDVEFLISRCKGLSESGILSCDYIKDVFCQNLASKSLVQLDIEKLRVLLDQISGCPAALILSDSIAELDGNKLLISTDSIEILDWIKEHPNLRSTVKLNIRLRELRLQEKARNEQPNDDENLNDENDESSLGDSNIQPISVANEDEMKEMFWKALSVNTQGVYEEYLKKYPRSPYVNTIRMYNYNLVESEIVLPDFHSYTKEQLASWFLQNFKKSKLFSDFILTDSSYATAIARWASVNVLYQGQYTSGGFSYFQPGIDFYADEESLEEVKAIMDFIYRPIYKEFFGYNGLFVYDRSTSRFVENYVSADESTVLMDAKTQKVVLENYSSIENTKNPHCIIVRSKKGKERLYNTYQRAFVTEEFDEIREIDFLQLRNGSFERKLIEAMQFELNELILGFKCLNYSSNVSSSKIVNGTGKGLFGGTMIEDCLLKGHLNPITNLCGNVIGYSMEYYDSKRNSQRRLKDINLKNDIYPGEVQSCYEVDYFGTALIQKDSKHYVVYNFDKQKVLFELPEINNGSVSMNAIDLPLPWYQYDFPVGNSIRKEYDEEGGVHSLPELCGYRDYENFTNISNRLATESGAVYLVDHSFYSKAGGSQKNCYLISLDGKKLFESKKEMEVLDSYKNYIAIRFGEENCGIINLNGDLIWQSKGGELKFINEKFAVYYQGNNGSYKNMGLYNFQDKKVVSDQLFENIYLKKDGIYGIRLGVDSKICDW